MTLQNLYLHWYDVLFFLTKYFCIMKNVVVFILLISTHNSIFAQIKKDTTIVNQYDEVVVTATRTERKLGNIAVPVTIVKQQQIQQSGSLRLQDILQEQSGLYITNSFGSGIQMQGLSPDYTLILIDGEPIVGRNGGVLDLNRITVNNIKKIEIVKGPSSSLYGSEALAGVINIITNSPTSNTLTTQLRAARFNTTDANISAATVFKNGNITVFGNRYHTDGYDFNPNTVGKTTEPYTNYTGQIKVNYQPFAHSKITYSNKLYQEKQNGQNQIDNLTITNGKNDITEYNHSLNIYSTIKKTLKNQLRLYSTQYRAETIETKNTDGSIYYYDYFKQNYYRVENQTDYNLTKNNTTTLGIGLLEERLNTNRYSGIRKNTQLYSYLQNDWSVTNKLNIIAGVRYDDNKTYQAKVSPKVAASYAFTKKWRVNISYGAGYKAPDYRQQFLNFTNNVAGGYIVYGANEISYAQLLLQQQQGKLNSLTADAANLTLLKPETSTGVNIGLQYNNNANFSAKLNVFKNDITNQIVNKVVAFTNNFAPVFSYFNVKNALTQGVEMEGNYTLNKYIQVQVGYQYLQTADKDILNEIKAGKVFGKKEGSLTSVQLARSDYGGLNNTATHLGNIKLYYNNEKLGWFGNIRLLTRSKWGVQDKDGNLILNRNDEYAKGYAQVNMSAGKIFKKGLQLQTGVDNVTNYKDTRWLLNNPGINYYVTVKYKITQQKK